MMQCIRKEYTQKETQKEFTKEDLFINPSDPELPYRRRKDEEKTSIHWGQRKLLLVLVQFLTLFWDPVKVPKPIVIYAGAAPGTNIGIVSMLFPEIEFHLYDPSPFKIKPTDKIHIYQDYFTDDVAKQWSGRDDILFVSDIRTGDYTSAKNLDENEAQIMKDMQMQMDWLTIINPVEGHLKFRPPYTGGNRPDSINYLSGHVLKQPWGPQTTTESRLVPIKDSETKKWKITPWSTQKYQDQMFNHNVIIREKCKYFNPFGKGGNGTDNKGTGDDGNSTNRTDPIDSPELMNDWDSRAETQIWMDYLKNRSKNPDQESVLALSRLITKKLTKKSKYKDTLHILRSNPQSIKVRNFKKTRDNRVNRTKTRDNRVNRTKTRDNRVNRTKTRDNKVQTKTRDNKVQTKTRDNKVQTKTRDTNTRDTGDNRARSRDTRDTKVWRRNNNTRNTKDHKLHLPSSKPSNSKSSKSSSIPLKLYDSNISDRTDRTGTLVSDIGL